MQHAVNDDRSDVTLWIEPDFLKWPIHASMFSPRQDTIGLNYKILDHAEELLGRASPGQDLCCVIIQLNRAIDFRDKLLDSIYHFKSIPGARTTGSKFNKHEFMTRLGLMKQVMKTELDDLRNDLEHLDPALTPSVGDCRRFARVHVVLPKIDRQSSWQSFGRGHAYG